MKKKLLLFGASIFLFLNAQAGPFDGVKNMLNDVKQDVYDIAPTILAIIFLGGVLMNIGKIWGADRDWKGFITNMVIFLLIVAAIGGGLAFIGGWKP